MSCTTSSSNIAAVKNKAKPANTLKLMDKPSEKVLSDDKVMLMEHRIMMKIDQNKNTLRLSVLLNIVFPLSMVCCHLYWLENRRKAFQLNDSV